MTGFAEPSTALALHPLSDLDPREAFDGRMLIEATRNAYPVVTTGRPKRDSLGVLAGTSVAAILGLLTFWTMSGHRTAPVPANPRVETPAGLPAPATKLGAAPAPMSPPAGTLILPHTQPWGGLQSTVHGQEAAPARAPMIVFDNGAAPASLPANATIVPTSAAPAQIGPVALAGAAEASTAGSGSNSSSNADDGFFSKIDGRNAQVATAQQLSNPGTTVTQGTLIAAVLETSINTDLPGYVRALVSRDVRSFDGSQVLIPRSSRLIGQYKSGLAQGQTRAYVIWTRLIRPDGVSVTLDSPGVDFSGGAGLPGKVNSHFMKRFGSALLLSVVGGLSAIGTGGASVIAGSGGQTAASVAAGRDGTISPTVRVAQGEPIRIFTARDLDFSKVPRLAASR